MSAGCKLAVRRMIGRACDGAGEAYKSWMGAGGGQRYAATFRSHLLWWSVSNNGPMFLPFCLFLSVCPRISGRQLRV